MVNINYKMHQSGSSEHLYDTKELKIYCIYNANGSLFGEISYLWKKYTSKVKCSLCNITHNTFFEKLEWKKNVQKLKISLETIHLNERSSNLMNITNSKAPCVILKNKDKYTILVNDTELDKMAGDVNSFFKVLNKRINQL